MQVSTMSPEEVTAIREAMNTDARNGWDEVFQKRQLYYSLSDDEKAEPLGVQFLNHIVAIESRLQSELQYRKAIGLAPVMDSVE